MSLATNILQLNRDKVAVVLYRQMGWYKKLDDEQRYRVEERIGMCVGAGDCTVEAYALARMEVNESLAT